MARQREPIPERVKRALFVLSRGRCYAPGCSQPVIVVVNGKEPVFVGQVAHIVAASKAGPRGDVPIADRRSFSNLLLLCGIHHKIIDSAQTRDLYSPDILRRWKEERERDFDSEALAELNRARIDAETLPEMLLSSFKETTAELSAEVDRLEKAGLIASSAAEMLRDAVASIPEWDSSLHQSTVLLAHFADAFPNFDESARALSHFVDTMPNFDSSAMALSEFRDYMPGHVLSEAATAFGNFATQDLHTITSAIRQLEAAIHELPTPNEYREAAREAARHLAKTPSRFAGSTDYHSLDGQPAGISHSGVSPKSLFGFFLAGLLVGVIGTAWITHNRVQGAEEERKACTGSSAPPNFVVMRQVKVDGSPSTSPSPFACETWYPQPIPRTSTK